MASIVEKADLDYAYEFIKRICVEIGPGSPCSSGEHARAAAIKTEMDKVADETKVEGFLCAPDAFLKWFMFASSLAVVAAAFFFLGLLPYSPLIFTTIGMGIAIFIVLMLVLEFILFKEFVDGLYPKKPSENIVGIIKPGNPSKSNRILIFSGHHDSALQFNYLRYFKQGYFIAQGILIVGVVIFAIAFVLRWISLAFSSPWDWLVAAFQWYSCILLPVCVFIGYTFTERGKDGGSVPGAIDNLSAVAIILMIGRILKRHPEFQPSDTEIRLVSFGCEEAGTRGSRAYVRAHETELKTADATVINFESIYDPEIEIFTGDRNGTIRNSPEVISRLAEAAKRARVPGKITQFPFAGGGTDALPFREKGIRAASLFGMKVPSQMMQFYHQPSDTYDKVNPAALENAVRIALEFIRRF